MHPLSVFPQLLTYGLIAPLLLRLVVGLFVLNLGQERYGKQYSWAVIFYIVAGALLIVGLYTQIAVIATIIILKLDFYINRKTNLVSKEKYILQVVMNVILLSLLFTGPGFLAFDLPL